LYLSSVISFVESSVERHSAPLAPLIDENYYSQCDPLLEIII
jgi:hypothetical protein